MRFEFFVIHTALFRNIGLKRAQVAELALIRRVIHKTNNAHTIFWAKAGQFFEQRLGTNLCAKVDKVTDFEHALSARGQQFIRDRSGIFTIASFATGMDRANAQRVKYGGDPC